MIKAFCSMRREYGNGRVFNYSKQKVNSKIDSNYCATFDTAIGHYFYKI